MLLFGSGKMAASTDDGMQTILWTELYNQTPGKDVFGPVFWEIEQPTDPRHIVARTVDNWRSMVMTDYISAMRSLCQNPCRIRRCLANVLQDVDHLNHNVSLKFSMNIQDRLLMSQHS